MKKIFLILALLLIASFAFSYTITQTDVLQIKSIGAPELDGVYTITPEGFITIPYAGKVMAVGKTDVQLTKEIETLLSSRVKNPEIYLSFNKITDKLVFVAGSVKSPGTYILREGYRINNALVLAGDIYFPTNDNEKSITKDKNIEIKVKSVNGNTFTIPYTEVLNNDYEVQNGDIITAELCDTIQVNVAGHVNKPGLYKLTKDNNSVMSAIILAGGFKDNGDYSQVQVFDISGKGNKIDLSEYVNGTISASPVELTNYSTIIVPELIANVTVLGWVKTPGKQTYRPDQTIYLSDVIATAGGGIQNKARYREIYVMRNVNGEFSKQVYNFNNFKNKGDVTGNPIIKSGDVVYVPCSLQIDWNQIISSIRSVVGAARDVSDL